METTSPPATPAPDTPSSLPGSRPRLVHYAEYAAIRGAVAGLRLLGFSTAGNVGAWIGTLGYRPFGIRRGVVERHLAAAFPDLPANAVRRIAIRSYAHLARTSVETALLPLYGRDRVLALFERVEGWSIVEERLARGKGLIFVSGHLGNWELGGSYTAARGVPLQVVVRGMANPLFDRYLTATRERIGMGVVNDAAAVRRVPRTLRAGGAVAFLVDQGVAGLASTYVRFFGRWAKTPRGPAVFALRLGAPVVFGVSLRQPNGKYVLSFEPIETERTGNVEADVDRIVERYTAVLEGWVRRAPDQYFWHHRRWKHQRPGTPPELGEP